MSMPGDPQSGMGPSEPDPGWGPVVPPPGMPPGFDPLEQQSRMPKVAAPAIAMMVVGALTTLFSLLTTVLALVGGGLWLPMGGTRGVGPSLGLPLLGNVASGSFGLLVGVFTLAAAVQMHRLRTYGLAMAGAIAMLIPCGSPCCLANVGIGIWALVVLSDPAVKARFR